MSELEANPNLQSSASSNNYRHRPWCPIALPVPSLTRMEPLYLTQTNSFRFLPHPYDQPQGHNSMNKVHGIPAYVWGDEILGRIPQILYRGKDVNVLV